MYRIVNLNRDYLEYRKFNFNNEYSLFGGFNFFRYSSSIGFYLKEHDRVSSIRDSKLYKEHFTLGSSIDHEDNKNTLEILCKYFKNDFVLLKPFYDGARCPSKKDYVNLLKPYINSFLDINPICYNYRIPTKLVLTSEHLFEVFCAESLMPIRYNNNYYWIGNFTLIRDNQRIKQDNLLYALTVRTDSLQLPRLLTFNHYLRNPYNFTDYKSYFKVEFDENSLELQIIKDLHKEVRKNFGFLDSSYSSNLFSKYFTNSFENLTPEEKFEYYKQIAIE